MCNGMSRGGENFEEVLYSTAKTAKRIANA
jgi:hypothetical protein